MQAKAVIDHLVNWLRDYCEASKTTGFVIGVSGGVDSAVTSALCALTGKNTLVLEMPIYQAASQVNRAQDHIAWLQSKFQNVSAERVELTAVFDQFMTAMPKVESGELLNLSLANTRARIRMTTLYYFAGLHKLLVAGTGNKVEDFGVGFFTKYGDGGVDLSPIADLNKTDIYEIGRELGIIDSIMKAAPTDGLWGDDRTDQDQIGASYPELEWAMSYLNSIPQKAGQIPDSKFNVDDFPELTERQKQILKIYWQRNRANRHKMEPIPVCLIPRDLRF
ncbi:MAG: NAD(+) synthase [Flavobacteriales bacterium]|nr:NAD(+) synthase [Flavobacteriales bacterium]